MGFFSYFGKKFVGMFDNNIFIACDKLQKLFLILGINFVITTVILATTSVLVIVDIKNEEPECKQRDMYSVHRLRGEEVW